MRLDSSDGAYSGILEKLFGLTMTLYVPGARPSAFLSRSSSVVKSAKEGRLSRLGMEGDSG